MESILGLFECRRPRYNEIVALVGRPVKFDVATVIRKLQVVLPEWMGALPVANLLPVLYLMTPCELLSRTVKLCDMT